MINLLEEHDEWDRIVAKHVGTDAQLIHVSMVSTDIRVFEASGEIVKIRRLTPATCRHRINSYADEAAILRQLAGLGHVPKLLRYWHEGAWEFLATTKLTQLQVPEEELDYSRESLADFCRVIRAIFAINRLGISHGDVHRRNVGRNLDGQISCFDFDQAVSGAPHLCFLRDAFGTSVQRFAGMVPFRRRALDVVVLGIFARSLKSIGLLFVSPLKFLFAGRRNPGSEPTEPLTAIAGNDSLTILERAWSVARQRATNDEALILYSLDVRGFNLRGQCPWPLVWALIRKAVQFDGKRVLELDCGLGLVSVHACLAGAVLARGLDPDARTMAGAAEIATTVGVGNATFGIQPPDLSSWGGDRTFDLVSASMPDPKSPDCADRWRFLEGFKEVLLSGDTKLAGQALDRLRTLGFSHARIVGRPGRRVALIFATKLD